MSHEHLVNAGGEVKVEHLTFRVAELSVAAEAGLVNRLRSMAKAALGPGSFFARAAPVIDWLKLQGRHADAAVLQKTVSEMVAAGAGLTPDAVQEFNQSPDGVAEELFWRTRRTHPDVTRDELGAVINQVNALEVYVAIQDAVAPKKATTPG